MHETKSIKKNFLLNSILTVTTVLVPLITFPYISRVLLVEANGKVNFASSVINYFVMFSALGIPTYGIRACARVRDDKEQLSKTVHELLFINTVMTVITYTVFLCSLFLVPKFSQEKTLFLITSLNLLLNVVGMNWLYSALEEYKYITIRSLIVKLFSVICIFTLLHSPKDYKIYALILVVSTVGSNLFNFVYSRHFVSYKYYGHYEIKKHLKPIVTFFATTVAISIYANLDTVMLGFVAGDIEVGYYSAALKIRNTLATLAVSLGTVLLPRLSYWAQNKEIEKFKMALKKSFQFMFFMAIPITVYFVIYAKPTILLFSGKDYAGAILPTQWLVPTVFFAGLSNVTGTQAMVPFGNENKMLISILWGAVTNFSLNCVLIPKYGSAGAAFATMITEVVVLGIQCVYIRKLLSEIKIIKFVWKPAIASIISILCSLYVTTHVTLSLFGELAVSSLIFGLGYISILIFAKEELMMQVFRDLKKKLKE